jgi:hypothetical protein
MGINASALLYVRDATQFIFGVEKINRLVNICKRNEGKKKADVKQFGNCV